MESSLTGQDYRVLLLAPTRRDAATTRALLERAGVQCTVCDDTRAVAEAMAQSVGCLLLTDEAFHDANINGVIEALGSQPPWSDIPAVLLCRSGSGSPHAMRIIGSMPNVTVLERPASSRTIVSSVQAALRARRRQYQMREQFSALRSSETALKTASAALSDSNRRKDEFLAMLAHELRNPLAPIKTASEILARKFAEDQQATKTIAIVKRQVTHLVRIVDDLLDVARITEGRIELRPAPVPVSAIVSDAVEIVEPLLRERNHKLLVGAIFERLYLSVDHARLVQCMANVLTNAAKYTDPGGEIRIEVQKRGNRLAIIVSDSGVGISPELLPRIFDLFVQGARSLDRAQGGLGIGLSVVKRLVEMHDGTITAQSDGLGRGSTFVLDLPLIDPPRSLEPLATKAGLRARRILIVDDNADAADTLAALLRLEGHEAHTVYTGRDAISVAGTSSPDVVLLDIGLPDMSGYEAARLLRSKLNSVRLVALTGYGQIEDLGRARAAGFDGHLVKPIDIETLTRTLQELESATGAYRSPCI
jgi:signal transduction histidine kinase/ActR/RegA family two-component response regulator